MPKIMARCLCCLIGCFSVILTAEPLRIVVPDFKPFTYEEDGQIKGLGVEYVDSVLDAMEQDFTIRIVPNYGRALAELLKGNADAFYLATENDERNRVAQFSEPITFNRWSWFTTDSGLNPAEPGFRPEAQIGTILNTNTHRWLENNGYQVGLAARDIKSLITAFLAGRLDAVFMAEIVFLNALSQRDDLPEVTQIVEVTRPFGVYFSNDFLANDAEFLHRFNQVAKELGFPR